MGQSLHQAQNGFRSQCQLSGCISQPKERLTGFRVEGLGFRG